MKPIILITSYYVHEKEFKENRIRGVCGQDMIMSNFDYIEAIEASSAIPLVLPCLCDKNIKEIINVADGIVFTGGEDVHPKFFNEMQTSKNLNVVEKRDIYEIELAKVTIHSQIPILGICRGMQLLNIVEGGNIYQDIYNSFKTNILHGNHGKKGYETIHNNLITEGSRLYDIFNSIEIPVNSYHHQVVKTLPKNFIPTSYSEDGFIEAYEKVGNRFFMGVQWHPEMMYKKYPQQLNIFKKLVEEAVKYKKQYK